jgi:hypothetical protein
MEFTTAHLMMKVGYYNNKWPGVLGCFSGTLIERMDWIPRIKYSGGLPWTMLTKFNLPLNQGYFEHTVANALPVSLVI